MTKPRLTEHARVPEQTPLTAEKREAQHKHTEPEREYGPELPPESVSAPSSNGAGLNGSDGGVVTLEELWQGVEKRWQALARIPLALILASALLMLSAVQMTFQIGQSLFRSYIWVQETEKARVQVAQLQGDIAMLEQAIAAANDPTYLDHLARCQGFVGKAETVVVDSNIKFDLAENCTILRVP